ncbi:MAG TPA: glycine cleavage system aminomethyltransferase GcvT [Pirellulales bacterium]|jgi:aminomethyltransferase|nr:glycine cleavage system aminomethyltransferase GcvT [Pirellulales bacterium]
MNTTLAQTALHDWHVAHGGRMVDFAGWSMPVQYSSIVAEHKATRAAAGLFDISHMGRLRFQGAGARAFLDGLVTRRVSDEKVGGVRYSLVTNEAGGILDDVLVYHVGSTGSDTSYYMMIVNASNRRKIVEWIEPRRHGSADVRFADITGDWSMIAAQGPRAITLVQPLVDAPLADMKYYTCTECTTDGSRCVTSRTGYTGEDGFELIVESENAARIWQKLVDAGATPAALGCRDTLRLEAAMPLYGHELSEDINPYQAGLGFAVNLEDRRFPGRDALARFKDDPNQPKRVGLEFDGKRVPREGFTVVADDRKVGTITSGTFSPTLNKPIAMAYVDSDVAAPGTELLVDIRGRDEPARVVLLPFYRRK